MIEKANITIIAAESFKNDPSSSVKYLLKVIKRHPYLKLRSTIDMRVDKHLCDAFEISTMTLRHKFGKTIFS